MSICWRGLVDALAFLGDFGGVGEHLALKVLAFRLDRVKLRTQIRFASLGLGDGGPQARDLVAQAIGLGPQLGRLLRQAVVLSQRVGRPLLAKLLVVELPASGLARLVLDRPQAAIDFVNDVFESQEVLLDTLQLALGFFLARLVAADAGGFLENHPPLLGIRLDQVRNLALLDDRVAADPHAGIAEDFLHILEADGLLVEQVLALAGPIEAAGNGDLVVVDGQGAIGVVEGHVDLGQGRRLARPGAEENHILHLVAAQAFGALIAQHPLDRVDDVALAAAVGSDDAGHAALEVELQPVGKALEPFASESLEKHKSGRASICPNMPTAPSR